VISIYLFFLQNSFSPQVPQIRLSFSSLDVLPEMSLLNREPVHTFLLYGFLLTFVGLLDPPLGQTFSFLSLFSSSSLFSSPNSVKTRSIFLLPFHLVCSLPSPYSISFSQDHQKGRFRTSLSPESQGLPQILSLAGLFFRED